MNISHLLIGGNFGMNDQNRNASVPSKHLNYDYKRCTTDLYYK